MKHIFTIAIIFYALTACTKWWKGEEYNPYENMTAKQLLTDAKKAIAKEQYESASKHLEAMESMYPFSDYTEQAQLNLIYAYYKKDDFASAVAAADRFIHLYPRSKHVDYAYYMKGLANFQQPRGNLSNKLPIDESWRDPGTQAQAYTDFSDLISKFPDSKYKPDALQRMIYLRNMFAQRELNTANYYFQRKMYVAAIERANFLVKNYPQAPSAQGALAIMYFANKALGLIPTANEAFAVYQATYHRSPVLPKATV